MIDTNKILDILKKHDFKIMKTCDCGGFSAEISEEYFLN
jgi:hypothetical protein